MLNSLILGTRGSALALAQTELTKTALKRVFPSMAVSMETFITQGDKKLDLELLRQPSGGKGLFTKELEEALFDRRIEVAVHSLKDLPGNMPAGLVLSWLVNNIISITQQLYMRSSDKGSVYIGTLVASVIIFGVGFVLTLI